MNVASGVAAGVYFCAWKIGSRFVKRTKNPFTMRSNVRSLRVILKTMHGWETPMINRQHC